MARIDHEIFCILRDICRDTKEAVNGSSVPMSPVEKNLVVDDIVRLYILDLPAKEHHRVEALRQKYNLRVWGY